MRLRVSVRVRVVGGNLVMPTFQRTPCTNITALICIDEGRLSTSAENYHVFVYDTRIKCASGFYLPASIRVMSTANSPALFPDGQIATAVGSFAPRTIANRLIVVVDSLQFLSHPGVPSDPIYFDGVPGPAPAIVTITGITVASSVRSILRHGHEVRVRTVSHIGDERVDFDVL
jgi:hypothetical protein